MTSTVLPDIASSEEIIAAIKYAQMKFKNSTLVGVGMSMGANLMLRVAGE